MSETRIPASAEEAAQRIASEAIVKMENAGVLRDPSATWWAHIALTATNVLAPLLAGTREWFEQNGAKCGNCGLLVSCFGDPFAAERGPMANPDGAVLCGACYEDAAREEIRQRDERIEKAIARLESAEFPSAGAVLEAIALLRPEREKKEAK